MHKKLFYIFLFGIWAFHSFGQNLIYNGDFEEYSQCPDNYSIPSLLQLEYCKGWTAPRKQGTADYFNVCNNTFVPSTVGVPNNLFGKQEPFNGSAYTGLYCWSRIDYDLPEYREYIQTKLPAQLQKGHAYKLSFEASLAEYSTYTIKNVGGLLSSTSHQEDSYRSINAVPQVKHTTSYLTDSINWTKVEGYFIADGTEKYLTIGYFEDSVYLKDTLKVSPIAEVLLICYMYIDNVTLEEINFELPNVFTPNNDQTNDEFKLDFYTTKFTVVDRWGNKVFETTKPFPSWDGTTCNQEPAKEDTYFYKIEINQLDLTGFVQLIR